jgi:hypothetical protein
MMKEGWLKTCTGGMSRNIKQASSSGSSLSCHVHTHSAIFNGCFEQEKRSQWDDEEGMME